MTKIKRKMLEKYRRGAVFNVIKRNRGNKEKSKRKKEK